MKIILACENKKIKKYLSEIKKNNLIIKNVQYREAIIDILNKENNINLIFLYEKIPGEISIEDLIKKIKLIDKKIKIIIFLEKENKEKKIKLKNLEINNIYLINKINKKIFINILNNNSNKKILKNNQNKIKRIYYKNNNCFTKLNNKNKKENLKKIYIKKHIKKIKNIYVKIIKKYLSTKNKFDKKDEITKYKITKYKNKHKNKYKNINVNKNKLIGIFGEKNSGKTTIIYLIIIFLLEKNNKILLINLNNKNNYSKLNNKNINKKNNYKIIKNNYKKIKNTKIKNIKNIKNFKIINLIEKQFEKNLKKCKKDEEDKNIPLNTLNNISPDIDIFKSYNKISTPALVRRVNLEKDEKDLSSNKYFAKPDYSVIVGNNIYAKIDADKIFVLREGGTPIDVSPEEKDGFFVYDKNSKIIKLVYSYKQSYIIDFYSYNPLNSHKEKTVKYYNYNKDGYTIDLENIEYDDGIDNTFIPKYLEVK